MPHQSIRNVLVTAKIQFTLVRKRDILAYAKND